MSSVYYPAQVAVLFRRFINAISTFSLSSQYLLNHAKPVAEESTVDVELEGKYQNYSEWPWWMFKESWDWPWLTHRTEAINYSLARAWPRPSILLSSGQMLSMNEDLYPGPPPSSPSKKPPQPPKKETKEPDTIHKLLANPALYDPLRIPRNPIVLCHGLYGFDTRGPSSFPSLRIHYWSNVLSILRDKMKAEVIVTAVPGTGSITTRAETLDRQLQERVPGRGLNFLAHSMGGLDCRHLISHIKPTKYQPLSLTSVSTPHRGSPFMDWCSDNLGLGKLAREEKELLAKASGSRTDPSSSTATSTVPPKSKSTLSLSSLPSSFTTLLLSMLDSPAYANLTTSHLNNVFNPATPDDPRVKYFSVTGRMPGVNIWHPLWLPKMVLDDFEQKERERLRSSWEEDKSTFPFSESESVPLWAREEEWGNDCLVTVQSSKWGEFLGVMEGSDHWEIRGARGLELSDFPGIPSIAGLGSGLSFTSTPGLKDLGWFLKAWRKEEKVQQEALARLPQNRNQNTDTNINAGSSASGSTGTRQTELRKRERELRREKDDAVVKASTDKLSAVFDWVTERVPAPPLLGLGTAKEGSVSKRIRLQTQAQATSEASSESDMNSNSIRVSGKERERGKEKEKDGRRKNELESQEDLERFYIALSRKLYDEGL